MENKINIACFKSGSRTAEVKDIWQWDYGQILRIQGLNLPTAVEIHFSLDEHGGEAARRIGVTKDGVTDVPIPDLMVENQSAYGDSYYFFAYIYLADEESGNTEYKIRAKVTTRSKPEGHVSGGNDTFAEILKTVNEIAEDKVDVPASAKVGQVIAVSEVDEEGRPTGFEATDQGGGVSDEKIAEAVGTYMEEHPIDETDPTVPDWAKNPEKPSYTAEEVGADASGTAVAKVSEHNTASNAHNDIRLLVQGLTTRLNALADSDDTTLDQMSEVVAYVKSNKSLIDAITTSKINVSDIIDNLITNVSNKPLSAAQGVKLKALIDAIAVVELDESLSDNTKAAPAGVVGELMSEIGKLSEDVNGLKENGTSGGGTIVSSNDINVTKWKGKKIVVDGSSITRGGTGETQPTWSDYLKDFFGLDTIYNHAVSGTGWTTSGTTIVSTRMTEYETDADAVILMGDYNGIYGYTQGAGTIDDEPSSSGSYYARLKYIAEYLINKYPLCPIIWVVEPPRSNPSDEELSKTPMGYDSSYAKQSKCIEEVAELYGFTHCNLMKNTVFRPWIQANYNVTTADGTHPYNIIQHTMAQVIAETMKRTPLLYGYKAPDTPIEPDVPEVTLSSISATYTGGEVAVGTALTDLTGITVTGTYSDGSTSAITGYTLSGEIVEGTNTITVSYGGLTTTFTVAGIAESSGGNTVNPTTEAVKVFEGCYGTSTNANYNNYVITDVRVGDVLTFYTNWNAKATDNNMCCYLNSLPDSRPTTYNTNESLGITTAYLDSNAINQNYAYGIATHTVVQDSPYFIFPCRKDHLNEATWVKVIRS